MTWKGRVRSGSVMYTIAIIAAVGAVLAGCGVASAPGATPTASLPPTPTPTSVPGITFDMKQEYRRGDPIEVVIANNSGSTYYHQVAYPACFNLKFFDDTAEVRPYPHPTPQPDRLLLPGQFIVPEGTHCDLVSEDEVRHGEQAVLFTWHQDMCVEDVWGCRASIPVEPGRYRIEGAFAKSRGVIAPLGTTDSGDVATAEWTFVIVPDVTPAP